MILLKGYDVENSAEKPTPLNNVKNMLYEVKIFGSMKNTLSTIIDRFRSKMPMNQLYLDNDMIQIFQGIGGDVWK
jgi:hypothetical protein